jgi:16S rRNA (guanine(966)-N(2))-methyltransferase RsmD
MRIITGQYKGRHFDIPRTFKARPTTDFAKENIFNVLNGYIDFEGATALDLFSGTGSIALELVSRGCSSVVSVELDRDHHRFICDCLNRLGTQVCLPVRGDVFRYLRSCRQQFNLVFADPPYTLKELPLLPDAVISRNIIAPDGLFVLEHGKDYDFTVHPHFSEHRAYGSVNFSLFRP